MRWLLALGLIVLIGCRPSPPPADRLDSARRAMRQGDLARALSLLGSGPNARATPAERDAARLLEAEISLMRRDLDAAATRLDAPLADSADRPRLEVRRDYLRGYDHVIRGQLDQAANTLTSVVARADAAGATDVSFAADTLLGQVLYRLGRAAEANARLTTAIARAHAAGDAYGEASLLVTAGMGRLTDDRFDEALGYFERALALQSVSSDMVYATALTNAGICYARLGEFEKAIAVQTRAAAAHDARQIPIYIEQSHGELGNTYALMADPAKALPYLSRAHQVADQAGLASDAALWLDNLAIARIALAQWDEAESLNEQSVALKQRVGDTTLVYNRLTQANISAGRKQYERAITEFETTLREAAAAPYVQWQAHGGLAAALIATGQRTRGLAEFDRALKLIDLARTDLRRVEHRFAFLARMIWFHQSYVDALVRMGDDARALEVADLSRARVLAERTGEGVALRPSAAALMRRAAAGGVTLVAYWMAPQGAHAWVVTGSAIRRVDLPPVSQLDALVLRYRQFIEQSAADPLAVAAGPGDALAAAVLEPVRALIPRGSRVVLVPDGSLHGINFETLPVGTPKHYWIEDVTLTIAPSLGLGSGAGRAGHHAAPSLLVMGDALDPAAHRPQLQYAATEITDVARLFPPARTTVLRGAAAAPDAYVRSGPARFSLIHFAAHATANATSPLESAIELSRDPAGESKLYARDIMATPIAADLVTISACRGVGDRAYGGEGPVGLAWAFLRAGATRVVAGLWDVDDEASASLMAQFYAGLATGLEPSAALRAAKLSLIKRGGNLAKPFYWAPLQIFTTKY
ncbi:MAG: CHAT domain-containing tetratricopeptide repeat protein [Acidobacteriota bacterium]